MANDDNRDAHDRLRDARDNRVIRENLGRVMQLLIGEFGGLLNAVGRVHISLIVVGRDREQHYVTTMQPEFGVQALAALMKHFDEKVPMPTMGGRPRAFERAWSFEGRRPRADEKGAKAPAITMMRLADSDVALYPGAPRDEAAQYPVLQPGEDLSQPAKLGDFAEFQRVTHLAIARAFSGTEAPKLAMPPTTFAEFADDIIEHLAAALDLDPDQLREPLDPETQAIVDAQAPAEGEG